MSDERNKELIKALDEIWRFYEYDKQAVICFFKSGYKYFDKKAKEKEAEEMGEQLEQTRRAIQQITVLIQQKPKIDEAFIEKELEEIHIGFFRIYHLWRTTEDWKSFFRKIIMRTLGWKGRELVNDQQKPEIDKKYVEEKAEELYGETLLAFPRIKQKAHWIEAVTQIISDVKGRGKGEAEEWIRGDKYW